MYYVKKTMEVSCAHRLDLPYESPCRNLHGHNFRIIIYCKSKELNESGMVVDFKHIKNIVNERLDHKYINDSVSFNPTSENLAKWLCEHIPFCYRVEIEENQDNWAMYEVDE